MNFTTEITEIRTYSTENYTNIIKEVDWILTGTEGTVTFNVASTSVLPTPSDVFLPLDTISQAQVMSWLENTPEYLAAKAHLINRVSEQLAKETLVVTPLPWAETPGT